MARRKAVRKSGSQATRKTVQTSMFPADRLPSELIHMVFAYLEPKEAATFRWAGRVVAEIGLHYLTPKVCLRLREESYDQLLAIAEHPVASKCVVELEYETEGLKFLDREAFDRTFTYDYMTPERHDVSERLASLASARDWRALKRESRRNMRPPNTAKLLDRAWSVYEAIQADHKKVEQSDFFPKKLVAAFKRLPNLKRMSTPTISVHERCVAEIKGQLRILPTHSLKEMTPSCISVDMGPTLSILSAVESAALQIENFCCKRFNWQTMMQAKSKLPPLKRSMLHLQLIDLTFTEPPITYVDGRPQDFEISIEDYLERRGIRSFLTSAPSLQYLQYLRLSFRGWPTSICPAPRLSETIGDFHWPSLKTISLDTVALSEDSLVGFCEIHAHTLRNFSLRDIQLEQGSWRVTLHRMRRVFGLGQQLYTCTLEGVFRDDLPYIRFDMGKICGMNKKTLGAEISEYIRATDLGDITVGKYYEMIGFF